MFNKYVRIMYDEEIDLIANYHTSGRGIGMAPKDYHLSLYIFTLKPGIPLFLYQNNMHFRKMNDKFILRWAVTEKKKRKEKNRTSTYEKF